MKHVHPFQIYDATYRYTLKTHNTSIFFMANPAVLTRPRLSPIAQLLAIPPEQFGRGIGTLLAGVGPWSLLVEVVVHVAFQQYLQRDSHRLE